MNELVFEKATILIVDDNQNNLQVLCDSIADSGWEILVATDGYSAIEQAEYAQPDLILLDVMMPEMDGFETCEKLKSNPITDEIPIIFMTALSDSFDKVKGFSIGAVDYVTKPFYTEEVVARINVHLRIISLTKQLAQQKVDLEQHYAAQKNKLTDTLQNLNKSQIQLASSDKSATLRKLDTSTAHEASNPANLLTGNLSHLADYTSKLINHLQIYRRVYPENKAEIDINAQQIDLDMLIRKIPEIIFLISEEIEQISNIANINNQLKNS
ncbi:response regulator [Calothrix sp. UHCC 0171]|uniref:response regulator n=1 Tax=Calothrix sp. UHCC 0171 TaxID=3110245 RepID=UPI002B1FFA4D|nr:response regulator [Calothrix sp. UHCC 0171]MEA5570039.1 response regulator [Calothrix sp. UHCC 0171]